MDPLLLGALTTGLTTGLAPAQKVDLTQQKIQPIEPTETDNTFFIVLIIAALIVSAGTIYFITQKK